MKTKLIIACFVLWIGQPILAQEYFVRKNKDTTFCRDMEYSTNSQGYITELSYINKTGQKITIEGKSKLKDIMTLYYPTGTVERMPLKTTKPDSYCRYGERKVDGKLKLLAYNDKHQYSVWVKNPINDKLSGEKNYTMGTNLLYVLMPDGKYYNVFKRKDVQNVLIPYLNKCSKFKNAYKGKFQRTEEEFIEIIKLYNSLCN